MDGLKDLKLLNYYVFWFIIIETFNYLVTVEETSIML